LPSDGFRICENVSDSEVAEIHAKLKKFNLAHRQYTATMKCSDWKIIRIRGIGVILQNALLRKMMEKTHIKMMKNRFIAYCRLSVLLKSSGLANW